MGYIQELRRMVGNAPLIMVGAAVLIVNEQGELLMLLRTDNGCWGVPGGAMEPGERLEDTARRESLEETGLAIGSLTLLGVFSGPELHYQYPNGAEVYNVSVAYLTREVSGELLLDPAEHSRLAYFALDHLPDVISPPVRPILNRLIDCVKAAERAKPPPGA